MFEGKSIARGIMSILYDVGIPSRVELKSGGLDYIIYLHEDNWSKAEDIINKLPVGCHIEHHMVPESVERSVEAIKAYREALDEK